MSQSKLKLTAYAHSLDAFEQLKYRGFEYVALHPMLFPGIEMGMIPSEQAVEGVVAQLEKSGLEPTDLVTFNTWNALGLSGAMEQAAELTNRSRVRDSQKARGHPIYEADQALQKIWLQADLLPDGRQTAVPPGPRRDMDKVCERSRSDSGGGGRKACVHAAPGRFYRGIEPLCRSHPSFPVQEHQIHLRGPAHLHSRR